MNRISPADLFLRCGTDHDSFARIAGDLEESNRRSLCVFTAVAAAAMAVMLFTSTVHTTLAINRPAYLVSGVICLLLFAAGIGPAKRHRGLIYPCVYLFTFLMYAFGIALGTFIEPTEATVSFAIMLFAVPLLFTDRPLRMIGATAAGILAYFAAAAATQTPEMLAYNASSIIPYGLVSMVVGTYMIRIKAERCLLAQENRALSEIDQLTGLWNRRCFEQHLHRLREGRDAAYTICVFDVNGLKAVNDTLGHLAGDALIRGAADCVQAVFGPYGRCYRVGGDEFTAILEGPAPAPEELLQALRARTAGWHSALVPGLAVSAGIAPAAPGSTVTDTVQAADRAMYADKAAYYSTGGHDRRARNPQGKKD